MASKGQMFVAGTDGTDFNHRQKVESRYKTSVRDKAWLRFFFTLHYFLFAIMLIKLSEDILDRLDIFILELQELFIPKPKLWEWIWAASIIFSWTGFKAIRKNNVTNMKIYVVMTIVFSLLPILYCIGYYFGDFITYFEERSVENVSEVWGGKPLCIPWTLFGVVCLQVHFFQLWFSFSLIRAWTIKKSKD